MEFSPKYRDITPLVGTILVADDVSLIKTQEALEGSDKIEESAISQKAAL